MRAELFYETKNDQAIPLYLIPQTQWEEGLDFLTDTERNYLALSEFKAKIGDCCFIHNAQGLLEKAYVGSGDNNNELALAHAALLLPAQTYQIQGLITEESAIHWALAQYRFERYKKTERQLRRLIIQADALPNILALVQAQFLVRDLINRPTSDLGPKELAETVEQIAQNYGAQFKQWVGSELLEHNFPAIHAVGRASSSQPRLLSLTWGNEHHPRVTLVGKGVCFDSGGLDLKPASGMRLMKKDMGGAAHVIGLAHWIMERGLPICLQVLIPTVENAIGPDAFRPGDVLTMRNGLTVEIHNTDAEGRLVLADALAFACETKPELLIDFATLTGAARVSLGTEIAALFTNQDQLAVEVIEASKKVNDPVWQLPLFPAYEESLRSSIADLANASDHPFAGAITTGLFLQRFVDKTIPWLHLDIMAWNLGNKPGKPEGGEALGLRSIAQYLLKVYG